MRVGALARTVSRSLAALSPASTGTAAGAGAGSSSQAPASPSTSTSASAAAAALVRRHARAIVALVLLSLLGAALVSHSSQLSSSFSGSLGTLERARRDPRPPAPRVVALRHAPLNDETAAKREAELQQVFDDVLATLVGQAHALMDDALTRPEDMDSSSERDGEGEERRRRDRLDLSVPGVPGTGITSDREREKTQEMLDCFAGLASSSAEDETRYVYAGEGEDAHESTLAGMTVHKHTALLSACDARFYKRHATEPSNSSAASWAVRESLKYRFEPSERCHALARSLGIDTRASSARTPALSRSALCGLLAQKAILLVGDKSQYELHDLLLDWTASEPLTCYGDLYCGKHDICTDVSDDWSTDHRPFARLPSPPSAGAPSARYQARRGQATTTLRYRRADGLQASPRATDDSFVHPHTGLGEFNQQWQADARRADIIVLTKPPLPLPVSVGIAQEQQLEAAWEQRVFAPLASGSTLASELYTAMIHAAGNVTERVWLPELADIARRLRSGGAKPVKRRPEHNTLLIYRGGWLSHADCAPGSDDGSAAWDSPGDGPPPHAYVPRLSELISGGSADGGDERRRTIGRAEAAGMHARLQTALQNALARIVFAPRVGALFFELERPLAPWRSGMVGGSVAPHHQGGNPHLKPHAGNLRSSASGDCTRYCLPSPGLALEHAFVGALTRALQVAYHGNGDGDGGKAREHRWLGEGFVTNANNK